jgi:hypothetical protein
VKPRTTLILFAVFAVLLAVVLVFESRGKKEAAVKEKEGYLVDLPAADILKIELKKEDADLVFEKDDKGAWRITAPLEAMADPTEVNGLADGFAKLRIDRVVEKEAKDLQAFEIPKKEVRLWVKDRTEPVVVLIGMENPLDSALFAKREDDPRLVLVSSTLKTTLDKGVFDFRRKDVFTFDTAEVKSIRLRGKDVSWSASRTAEGWRLDSPVEARADRYKFDSLLGSLSGLRAKEFLSEDAKPEDIRKYGLEKPGYEVTLSLPAANKEIVFSIGKEGDKSVAMTSQTNKIVAFEGTLTADLDRKVAEYRDKKVADFYSWQADSVSVRSGAVTVAAAKEKDDKGAEAWLLQTEAKPEGDGAKIEAFLRKIEGLEAVSFIDRPGDLAAYGLNSPATEIRIGAKDSGGKAVEIDLLVGKEDPEKKQVFVKDAGLDYLFVVDSAFLQDLPKEAKDWTPAPPASEAPAEKK